MIISLMFLTGMLARIAMSNAVRATTAVAAWAWRLPERLWPTLDRALIEEYCDAVVKHGVGSPQAQAVRDSNVGNARFVAFADSMDRVKRTITKRHPHQVMRWEDLEVGREYTSVHIRECDGRMFEYRRRFVGAFSREPSERELLAAVGTEFGHHENMMFTAHLDGWTPWDFTLDGPSYILWGGDGKPNSYGSVAYLLGEDDMADQHQLLVPTDRWWGEDAVVVDWTEERPKGEAGEMVWMYDALDHTQIAAVISGQAHGATAAAGEPVYYVTFIRGREFGGGASCTLLRACRLTVRRDSEPVDKFCEKRG